MRVNRTRLIQHLERLSCAGQCTEAVFTGAFAAEALTPDQLLLITVPGLDSVEPLDEEIGIADVGLLIKALKLLPGEGAVGAEVSVTVERGRLVIDDEARGIQRLLTAAPKTIATRVEPSSVAKLFKVASGDDAVPLPKRLLEGVSGAFRLYSAEEIEVQVGPRGGQIVVGSDKTHRAEFGLEDVDAVDEYTLLFGNHLVDVFSVVTDFSTAALHLSGPGLPAVVTDGEYKYLLSPRARSVEDSREVKKAKAKEVAETPKAAPESPKARARRKVNKAAAE